MIRDVFTTLFSPRHDLKLVELQPEDSARMLDEGAHAQGARGGAGVKGGGQVPDLEISQGLLRAVNECLGFQKICCIEYFMGIHIISVC